MEEKIIKSFRKWKNENVIEIKRNRRSLKDFCKKESKIILKKNINTSYVVESIKTNEAYKTLNSIMFIKPNELLFYIWLIECKNGSIECYDNQLFLVSTQCVINLITKKLALDKELIFLYRKFVCLSDKTKAKMKELYEEYGYFKIANSIIKNKANTTKILFLSLENAYLFSPSTFQKLPNKLSSHIINNNADYIFKIDNYIVILAYDNFKKIYNDFNDFYIKTSLKTVIISDEINKKIILFKSNNEKKVIYLTKLTENIVF